MHRIAAALLFAVSVVQPTLAQDAGGPADQSARPANAEPARAVAHWNLAKKDHLALGGYDPVAYFPEGGAAPAKGSPSITSDYKGALYFFASAANRAAFNADPGKYEPAYGGWCAWAMLEGEKVEVDPKSFIVKDGRLFLFYDGAFADTRSKWLRGNHASQAATSDANWLKLSGEAPRLPLRRTALKDELDAKQAEIAAKAPPAALAVYEQGIRDVGASGVLATALKVGDTAPDFELPDARGGSASLKAMLTTGPVVVTWYRGGWCPYCNIQLRAYQEMLPELEAAGAKLVAISPQTPDASRTTADADGLRFAVLSDSGNRVARAYGIAYTIPEPVASSLERGVGLSKVNGSPSMELPLAATYVVDTHGRIVYAFVDADYRARAEPGAILAAVRSLRESGK